MQHLINLMDKVQKGNRYLIVICESIGIAALLLIMIITCADVLGAKLFLKPVPGSLDIVMLAQTTAVSFCISATLISGGHVGVEFFLMHMSRNLKRIVLIIIDVLSLILFALIVRQLAVYGSEMLMDGEVSPTAHIPIYPFAYGIAIAVIPACIELCVRILKNILGQDISV